MKKKVLILTKSQKHTAKCVVGIDIETNQLIRLITNKKDIYYSLSDEHLIYDNNTKVKLLDVAEIDFIGHRPTVHHPENWLINTNTKFNYIDNFKSNPELYAKCIKNNISKDKFIYINNNSYLTKDEFNQINKSIIICVVENINFFVVQYSAQKSKTKISFEFNDEYYNYLSYTSNYSDFKTHKKAIAVITLPDGNDKYCLENNRYYKFVAQIFPIPENNKFFE